MLPCRRWLLPGVTFCGEPFPGTTRASGFLLETQYKKEGVQKRRKRHFLLFRANPRRRTEGRLTKITSAAWLGQTRSRAPLLSSLRRGMARRRSAAVLVHTVRRLVKMRYWACHSGRSPPEADGWAGDDSTARQFLPPSFPSLCLSENGGWVTNSSIRFSEQRGDYALAASPASLKGHPREEARHRPPHVKGRKEAYAFTATSHYLKFCDLHTVVERKKIENNNSTKVPREQVFAQLLPDQPLLHAPARTQQ